MSHLYIKHVMIVLLKTSKNHGPKESLEDRHTVCDRNLIFCPEMGNLLWCAESQTLRKALIGNIDLLVFVAMSSCQPDLYLGSLSLFNVVCTGSLPGQERVPNNSLAMGDHSRGRIGKTEVFFELIFGTGGAPYVVRRDNAIIVSASKNVKVLNRI